MVLLIFIGLAALKVVTFNARMEKRLSSWGASIGDARDVGESSWLLNKPMPWSDLKYPPCPKSSQVLHIPMVCNMQVREIF
jgi:hypothetical protein